MRISVRLSGLLIATLLMVGCSAKQDLAEVQEGIAHFRQLMADRQFERIYSEGADQLKKSMTQQQLVRLLSAIDSKLGAVKSAESNGWSVNYNSSGTTVTLRFKTQFERGTGAETFTYRIVGGKALLANYQINSNDLIVNEPETRTDANFGFTAT